MTTMRGLIERLGLGVAVCEDRAEAEQGVIREVIANAQALIGSAGEVATRAEKKGDRKVADAANKAADAAERLVMEVHRWVGAR